MIVWSGWGILVAVVAVVSFLVTGFVINAAMQNDQYYETHGWPKLVAFAFAVAALIVWPLGRAFNRPRPDRGLLDPRTGEPAVMTPGGGHTLFFIPMEYWAPILLVLGVVFLFVK
jgi:hypothetical protein